MLSKYGNIYVPSFRDRERQRYRVRKRWRETKRRRAKERKTEKKERNIVIEGNRVMESERTESQRRQREIEIVVTYLEFIFSYTIFRTKCTFQRDIYIYI